MGTKSKQLLKGGVRKLRRVHAPLFPDHLADQRVALDHVRGDPECTARDVADTEFDGSLCVAHAALNALRNKGILDRRVDDRGETRYWFEGPE